MIKLKEHSISVSHLVVYLPCMPLTHTLPLLLTEPVAIIADASVPHWQVDAVSCPTDVWVHSTFVDLFKGNKTM